MKEIEKQDLPEVGGGVWSDTGCIPSLPDPTAPPTSPVNPDPTAPMLLDA